MTAEKLEELLGKVTQGEWTVETGKGLGCWVSSETEWFVNSVTDRIDYHDATLIAIAPSLARKVIAAEALLKSAQALCDRWDTSDWGGSTENIRHTGEFIAKLRKEATAYREANK